MTIAHRSRCADVPILYRHHKPSFILVCILVARTAKYVRVHLTFLTENTRSLKVVASAGATIKIMVFACSRARLVYIRIKIISISTTKKLI